MNWKLFTALMVFVSSTAFATPAQVLVIRHAEKNEQGNLSAKGWQRAEALAKLFTSDPRFTQFGPPVAIYAAKPKHDEMRTLQTVTPLASRLEMGINEDYSKKKIDDLAEEVLTAREYNGKTVVICWHHDNIPDIVAALGAEPPANKWSAKVFDRVWAVQFSHHGNAYAEDRGEHVLPGDSVAVQAN